MPVIVCPACDLAHRAALVPATERTLCARCRAPLQRPEDGNIDAAIALAASALVLYLLANAYPLVVIHSNGATRAATLIDATRGLFDQGDFALAALVFITTIVGPILQIASLLYVLIPLRNKRRAPGQNVIFRALTQIRPWTLIEVFMLGAVVALVRLAAFAQVVPGVSLWCCALLMLNLAALTSRTPPEQFWRWVEMSHT